MQKITGSQHYFARKALAIARALLGLPAAGDMHLLVRGDSMLPHLPDGTPVVVRPGMALVHPGSLIAYRRRGELILHRVLALRHTRAGRLFVTKGDNNPCADELVPEEAVVGRVVAVDRHSDL